MLLKCVNGNGVVVDPCPYPEWVRARYEAAEIDYYVARAEAFTHRNHFSEAWVYNVLQHVVDPEAVIETAKRQANVLRIFEWLETEPCEGHPHMLHAHELNDWIGGTGEAGFVNDNGATGLAYWGVFEL